MCLIVSNFTNFVMLRIYAQNGHDFLFKELTLQFEKFEIAL